MMKAKICGITNEEDALMAVNLGAHFIGLNFHSESPRKVSVDLAARIANKVPPFVPLLGVFVNQTPAEIVKIAQKVGLGGIQLHGDQTPDDCRAIAGQLESFVMRAFRIGGEADLEPLAAFQEVCKYVLLDARVEDQPGGPCQTVHWALGARAESCGCRISLADWFHKEHVSEGGHAVLVFLK